MMYVFDVANEIANRYYLVDVVIPDFHSGELIFNHYHQFQAIEPVSSEIISEVSFIRDTFQVDVQMLGNESAYLVGGKAAFRDDWLSI